MNSRKVLKWHIRVFKICGFWLPEDESTLYNFYTIIFSILVFVGLSTSQLISVFYLDSINAIVDHLILTSTNIMMSIKAFNLLYKRKVFAKLLQLMKQMDNTVSDDEEKSIFRPLFIDSDRMLLIFLIDYAFSWIFVAIQVIMSPPKTRIWSSTFFYPVEILHRPNIYIGGILFQAISTIFLIIFSVAGDSYGASLLHILGGHLNVLGSHIRNFGKNELRFTAIDRKAELVNIYKKYISIIELSHLKFEFYYSLNYIFFQVFKIRGKYFVICITLPIRCERTCAMHLFLSAFRGMWIMLLRQKK